MLEKQKDGSRKCFGKKYQAGAIILQVQKLISLHIQSADMVPHRSIVIFLNREYGGSMIIKLLIPDRHLKCPSRPSMLTW